MRHRKFINVLAGFSLAVIVGISYLGNGFIINKITDKRRATVVNYHPESAISRVCLNPSSVQGFVNSLQNFIYLNDCNSIKRVGSIDLNSDVLELYKNKTNTVHLTSNNGRVLSCKFSNLPKGIAEEIKNLATKDNSYSIKDVDNGFIIESRNI